jgi:serine/threonine protein kinase
VRLTRHPGGVGTDGYMAPEQASGAPPEPRQDLYAAGVVAAQLLSGRLGAPVPDGALRPLLEALASTDPGLRPPTAAAALERLRRIDVPPDGPWPDVPDRLGAVTGPPSPVWTGVAILCFLGAIALSAVAAYLSL